MIPPTLALPCTPPSVALALLAVTTSGTLKSVNGREHSFSCWVSRCRLSIQTVADGCKNSNSDFYKNDAIGGPCVTLQHPEVSCGALVHGLNPYRVLSKEMRESESIRCGIFDPCDETA